MNRKTLLHSRDIEPTPHWQALLEHVEALDSVLVAYSGGVDSTLLAKVCHDILGPRSLAVLAVSPSLPASERDEARELAALIGMALREVHTDEAEDPAYIANAPNRCYFCKSHLFAALAGILPELGTAAVAYGAITDDLGDVRPGMDAARRASALAPLLDSGLDKLEVREASRRLGLPSWDKPAMACLASRIPHGTPVTIARLASVEAAEAAIRGLGFRQVRVRHHGSVARIEVEPQDLPRALVVREEIELAALAAGFASADIDPLGYRRAGASPVLILSPASETPTP